MALTTRSEPLDAPVVQRLIAALNAELEERYPEPGATHFRLDPEDVSPGRGVLLVAREGDQPVGCGAVRLLAPQTAEVKRMYVVPEARGRGVARALMAALEEASRGLGALRMVLETGLRQPEAVALYRRVGFMVIPAFGEYVGSALSLCMGKELPLPYSVPAIELLNITPELASALEDLEGFERRVGVTAGDLGALVTDVVQQNEEYRLSIGAPTRWGGYLAADARRRLVGTCGFKGGPDPDGVVEIAYFTFPPFQRHGIAAAMAAGLMGLAMKSGQVRRIRAHTLPEDNASSRLLRRLRFEYQGLTEDPDDGPVWRWERPGPPG
jgi:putative acetyltransferase